MLDSAFSPKAIPLWPDGAPGSENWSQQEQETYLRLPFDVKIVRNIAQPTLTAYLSTQNRESSKLRRAHLFCHFRIGHHCTN